MLSAIPSSSLPTTSIGEPPARSTISNVRHPVTYRWRCSGAATRSARDLKPSSCAWDWPARAPRHNENASALSRAAAYEQGHTGGVGVALVR